MLNQTAVAALDRLDTISASLSAVSDLMNPEKDLHLVDRGTLATLLCFLTNEYQDARQCFTKALVVQ